MTLRCRPFVCHLGWREQACCYGVCVCASRSQLIVQYNHMQSKHVVLFMHAVMVSVHLALACKVGPCLSLSMIVWIYHMTLHTHFALHKVHVCANALI